ncbi:MAG: hypothetical protein ABL907_02840, partial [Hyphomicrobium sp.]
MRHLLGVLGVLAAGVLLAVSAAMNWSFGHGLGQTEFEGQLFGAASAAADCLKALVPFFFFAAIRNKMWSQATASVLVWVVVTGYSMTSALGMAAQARFDKAGQRTQVTQIYQDLRGDLKRAEEQAGWIPQSRPYEAVVSAIDSHKSQPGWKWSNGCKDVSSKAEQKYCQGLHNLEAERESAKASVDSNARIADIKAKLASMEGTTATSEVDPQAKVLTALASVYFPGVKIESVQMAMTVFVALLLEIGSGFGMYVAFSQWRLYDSHVPAAPRFARSADDDTVAATVAAPALSAVAVPAKKPRSGANDNRTV